MKAFVIRRDDDGKYVAPPGSEKSYTRKLEDARTFATRADAERDACGNETVFDVREILNLLGNGAK